MHFWLITKSTPELRDMSSLRANKDTRKGSWREGTNIIFDRGYFDDGENNLCGSFWCLHCFSYQNYYFISIECNKTNCCQNVCKRNWVLKCLYGRPTRIGVWWIFYIPLSGHYCHHSCVLVDRGPKCLVPLISDRIAMRSYKESFSILI